MADTLTFSPGDMLPESDHVRFMGLEFDPLGTADAVSYIVDLANHADRMRDVVTPNVDHMVRLNGEPELKPLYEGADVLVCDSKILEVLAKLEGLSLPSAPGADIVETLFAEHILADEAIVVIGGDEALIGDLKARYGLTNVLWHGPPFGLRKNPEAIADAAKFIVENTARFAFLCVGSPQQEMVAKAAKALGTGSGVMLCCGASLEFLTGKVERAPKWMRDNRLEWLHRLASEPGRLWKRYLIDGPRIFLIWWTSRGR